MRKISFETKRRLKEIIETSDTIFGQIFDIFIHVTIVLSIISFSVATLPGLSPTVVHGLALFEIVAVIIFTVEYLLRILVAENRPRFIFSFFGIVDLLAILPFYLAGFGLDLVAIRILRLIQLVRILKLARYGQSIERIHRAFKLIREELTLFFFMAIIVLYLSAVGIYYFENPVQPDVFPSIFHSLWWAIATLTTVGYGDIYPITLGGKVFTSLVLLIGLGFVAIPSGLLASALSKAREMK
uniref:Voltage-gated potassium channel n=1 Tax=Candidatus Kentrum sp. MB TaxID=2138164 RepID=A0A451BBM1_9GAMM|nr:MAG: voltage-gated potassium channel [Candidatus Kentron sp. MB]VFK75687.1 MAG: voltage-gated potassium channel [Candidatus Kentron sp. MB]